MNTIHYAHNIALAQSDILPLYKLNRWLAAKKPEALTNALNNSENVISAWDGKQLIGLGNAISDGHLVVYYPHLLVRPLYQKQGIGREIMQRLQAHYAGFHQQAIIAQEAAAGFYQSLGFIRAGTTESMWIYHDDEKA